jgi:hypothetical protein
MSSSCSNYRPCQGLGSSPCSEECLNFESEFTIGVGESKVRCICGHSVVRHFDLNAVKRGNEQVYSSVSLSDSLPVTSVDLPSALLSSLNLDSPTSQSHSSSASPVASSSRSTSPVVNLTVLSSVPTSCDESEGQSPVNGPMSAQINQPVQNSSNTSLFSMPFAMGNERRNHTMEYDIPSPIGMTSEVEPDSPLTPPLHSYVTFGASSIRALVPPLLSNPVTSSSNRTSPPAISPPSGGLRSGPNSGTQTPSTNNLLGGQLNLQQSSLSLAFSGLSNFNPQSLAFTPSNPFGSAPGASFVPLPRCAGCDMKVPFIGAQLCGSDCARTFLQWSDYSHHLFQRCSSNSPQRARLGCSFCRRLGHVRRECANAAVKCEQCKENFHSWGTSNQCRFKGFADKLEKIDGFWVYKEEFRSAQQRMAHAQATKLAQAQAQAQMHSLSMSHSLSQSLSNAGFPTQFSSIPGLDPIWRRS